MKDEARPIAVAGQQNTISEIKKYFEKDAEPISTAEFNEFWKSLSEQEKEEFRTSDLSK
jgi:uncharacterized protein YdaT